MRRMQSLTAGMLSVGALTGVCAAQDAVEWRVADGGNGHWYQLSGPFFSSWVLGNSYAEELGGHLVTLTSASEQTFAATLAFNSTPTQVDDCWLGAFQDYSAPTYSEPAGGWRWVTGESWNFTSWRPDGQPHGNGDFLVATTVPADGLGWVDSGPNHRPGNCQAFVEWSADCNNDGIVDYGQILAGALADANQNNIPDCCEAGSSCPGSAVQWRVEDGGNGHWYAGVIVRSTGASWTEARAHAQAMGGDLASLLSAPADQFVFERVVNNPALWSGVCGPWVGGWQQAGSAEPSGGWQWVNGDPIAESLWSPDQPDDATYCGGDNNRMGYWNSFQGAPRKYLEDSPDSAVIQCGSSQIGLRVSAVVEWSADCNNDGIVDKGQILSGQLSDTNGDGIPDVCPQLVPIHQFDFDTDLHDSVGAATGQFIGNCRVENGALIADGNSSYVQFDQYLIPSTGSVTVAMWVKSEPGQGIHEFISQGFNTNNFFLGRNYLETDRFRVGDQWFQTNTPYDWICGAWHHVAVVVNRATDRTQLWVDAQLKEERIGAITIPSNGIGLKTRLCAQYCCGEFFRGKLDQLRIYSSALTGPTLAEIVATSGYPCPGDISGNNSVDGVDLAALLGTWGTNGQGEFDCDIDNDGIVSGTDLTIILGGWGPCPN